MNRYFFIFGRNHALSFSELCSVFKKRSIGFKAPYFENGVLIIEAEKELDLADLNNRLGGLIKCGDIVEEAGVIEEIKEDIKKILSKEIILDSFLKTREKKNFLGFSLYLENEQSFSRLKKEIEKHFLTIKKELKKEGKKIRLVTSREKRLSSVVVKKNKLLTQGSEINIVIAREKVYLGRTKEVQDFEGYSFRDYRRPYRDMDIGLMPPKLAKILINLSRAEKEEVILDSFCGCGTILSEAILLGYKNVIGSDINLVAINCTKKNLDWLYEKYLINSGEQKVKILHFDVRKVRENLEPYSVKAVVTEPYLGPPIRLNLNEARAKGIIKNVSQLYLDFFREIKSVLLPRSKIAIIWPVFRVNGNLYPLPILEEVLRLGFEKEKLIPEEFSHLRFRELTKRETIIYSRTDQKVLREIFVFSAKGGSAYG